MKKRYNSFEKVEDIYFEKDRKCKAIMKYVKVIDGTKSNAGNYEYKIDEVNVAEIWNPKADNPKEMGGFNFSIEEKILRFIFRGDTIYDVVIPEDAEIVEIEHTNVPNGVFRANKIVLTNPRPITEQMVIDIYKKSTLPEKTYYQCLVTLLYRNYVNAVIYIIKDRINKNNVQNAIAEFENYILNKNNGTKNKFDYEKDLWNDDVKKVYNMLKKIEKEKI